MLKSVCGKRKPDPEDEVESCDSLPRSSSAGSSFDHHAIDMEPPPYQDLSTPVGKPVTPVEKPASPVVPPTPMSGGKRVQTPVTPIRGAGPEPNPGVISTKQTQLDRENEVFV